MSGAEEWIAHNKELYEQLTWIHIKCKPIVISAHMSSDLEIQDYDGYVRYLIDLDGRGYYKEVSPYYLENKQEYQELEDFIEWYLLVPNE